MSGVDEEIYPHLFFIPKIDWSTHLFRISVGMGIIFSREKGSM